MTQSVTVIRNAAWVVAWDQDSGRHVYLNNADVAFSSAGIVQVGGRYDGEVATDFSGSGLLVLPGFVNIHCHSGDEPIAKGLFEDVGTAALWGNALYEFSALVDSDEDAKSACQVVMMGDLMRSGVTTFLDIAAPHPKWLDLAVRSGLRAYLAPGFRQAQWAVVDSHRLDYRWDDAKGRERFEQSLAFIDSVSDHPSGRVAGVMTPSQIDTCSEDLIREAVSAARERGIPITIHAAQTMTEHEELLRRTGETAPAMLERLGILGPDLILGHCIFLDHHNWTRHRTSDDLVRLVASGTSVAHCPVTFARSGMTLQSLGRYRRAGVNVGIGTDSYPFNMLEEMREALICSRIAGQSVFDIETEGVFSAATIGGATALGRQDIGRLATGAKADLTLVDLTHPAMQPVHDPLRNLLHCAAERAVRDVYVDGEAIVRDRRILGLDYDGAVRELQEAQERACRLAETSDPQGRALPALAPLSLPIGPVRE
jgi:5-methylthioadenosine/S-adenosylhomocysteine deaminase